MAKSNHKFLVLAALIIAGAAIAFYLRGGEKTNPASTEPFANLAFEDLAKIEISKGVETTTLSSVDGENWGVAQRDGYPLDDEKLRKLVYSIVGLKTVDRMTDDPGKYEAMGVGDSPESGTLTLLDSSGAELAKLLIGSRRQGGRGQFIRTGDDPAVYMIGSTVTLNAKPSDWLDATLVELSREKVLAVSVTHEEGKESFTLRRSSSEEAFKIEGDESELNETMVNNLAGALSRLTMEDVYIGNDASLKDIDFTVHTQFETADGPVYTLDVSSKDDSCHLKLIVLSEAATGPTAIDLNNRTAQRTFKIAKYNCDRLAVKRSDLLEQ